LFSYKTFLLSFFKIKRNPNAGSLTHANLMQVCESTEIRFQGNGEQCIRWYPEVCTSYPFSRRPKLSGANARELRDGFDYIDEKGKPVKGAEISYRFVRKKDGKVFKWARFIPQYTEVHNCTALEEI
jgi:hypothetical protein